MMKINRLLLLPATFAVWTPRAFGEPVITSQPQSQAVILYQPAAFGVIASGTAALGYQWRKDGVPIADATNDQIAFAQPRFSDAGAYLVVVSNVEGSVTSADATLTVDSPKGGDMDYSLAGSALGADRPVTSVAVQSDGKVVIGGEFTMVNGMSRENIARLNTDGTIDAGFQSAFSGARINVGSVTVQSDGKVLIGGQFISDDEFSNSIARLNRDGTLDSSFQRSRFELGGAGVILSVAVQRDGKVLVGGQFATVNGVSHNSIARLNTDGILDSGFQSGLHFDIVRSIAVQSDGKVLIGSHFMDFARLNVDGTPDSGFQPEVDDVVRSVAVQNDGKVVVGGDFTTVKGVDRNRIARLNADGTLDDLFQNGLSGVNASVWSLALQSDGKVLIGGLFTTVNGVRRNGIARLNADGTLDSGFQDRLSGAYGPARGDMDTSGPHVNSVAIQGDGMVLIGGGFTTVNGVPARGIARLWGNQPLYIDGVTRPNVGSATLTLRLPPGSTNRVQFKADLTDAAWTDLPGDVIASGSDSLTNKVDATLGAAQRRFYRVRQLP